MNSPLIALTRDFWRSAWLGIGLAILGSAGFASLVYGALIFHGVGQFFDMEAKTHMHFAVFMCSLFGISTGIIWTQRTPEKRFTLPISTRRFVACAMANSWLAAVLAYVVLAIFLNWLFRADWPMVTPALVAGTTCVCAHAVIWTFHTSLWAQFAASLVTGTVVLQWTARRYGLGHGQDLAIWSQPNTLELVTMVVAIGVAYVLCSWGVDRARHGNPWNFSSCLPDWRIGMSKGVPYFRPFKSSTRAQFWYEWRRSGLVLPAFAVVGAVSMVVGAIWFPPDRSPDQWEVLHGFSVAGGALCFLVGMYLGHRSKTFDIDSFLATKPITSTAMAWTVLRSGTLGFAIGAAIWSAGIMVAASHIIARYHDQLESSLAVPVSMLLDDGLWAQTAGAIIFGWCCLATGIALGLARPWLIPAMICSTAGSLILLMIASIYLVPKYVIHEYGTYFDTAVFASIGLGLIVLPAAAFIAAFRRQLISIKVVGVSFLVGLIACLLLIYMVDPWQSPPSSDLTTLFTNGDLSGLLLILGIVAFYIAPIAAAPLALDWNRHR